MKKPVRDFEKKDRTHAVRIPERLHHELALLDDLQMKALNPELREVIAKHVHLSKFDPAHYLSE